MTGMPSAYSNWPSATIALKRRPPAEPPLVSSSRLPIPPSSIDLTSISSTQVGDLAFHAAARRRRSSLSSGSHAEFLWWTRHDDRHRHRSPELPHREKTTAPQCVTVGLIRLRDASRDAICIIQDLTALRFHHSRAGARGTAPGERRGSRGAARRTRAGDGCHASSKRAGCGDRRGVHVQNAQHESARVRVRAPLLADQPDRSTKLG